jgi:CDI immunity protein
VPNLASNWCSIHSNLGFISVSTSTGYRRSAYDPNGVHVVHKSSVTDEKLGHAIREALGASKPLKEEDISEFFSTDNAESNYAIFVERILKGMGDISRVKAFKNMKLVHVVIRDNKLALSPTKKERGEAWSGKGLSEESSLVLCPEISSAELGAAAKSVIEACK